MNTATTFMGAFALTIVFGALATAVFVLSGNPSRFTNQVFAAVSVVFALMMSLVYKSIDAGMQFLVDGTTSPIPWLKANAAVGTFIPPLLIVLCESLGRPSSTRGQALRRALPWFFVSAVLAVLCTTESYIPSHSRPNAQVHGVAYAYYSFALLAIYLVFIVRTARLLRQQTGIRRLEMQFLVLNFGIGATIAVSFFTLGNLLKIYALKQLGLLAILGVFILTAWSVCQYRIFNVREVFASLGQRVVLTIVLTVIAWLLAALFIHLVPPPIHLLIGLGFACAFAFWLDRHSRNWLGIDGDRRLAVWRQEIISISRTEADPARLTTQCEDLLCRRFDISHARVLVDSGPGHVGSSIELPKRRPAYAALLTQGWASPETLERQRSSPAREDLRAFMEEHRLGLVISAPHGSSTPSLVIALGQRKSGWPFTYPEIERLLQLAELIDNILTRSRLMAQAALRTRMEHLSTMSRGLAHDLKNLITPVSSFLVHTEGRYPPHSDEAEVHSAAQRSIRIMTDYVRAALAFSETLQPRFESIDLRAVFDAVRDATLARAGRREITLVIDSPPQESLVADAVLLQRLFANLVSNAIDASQAGQSIRLAAGSTQSERIRVTVSDAGSGIAPERLARVFEPYYTTKEFGDDIRGFGLGLTICKKITELHGGTIAIHSVRGIGTTVTVELPRHQSPASSAAL